MTPSPEATGPTPGPATLDGELYRRLIDHLDEVVFCVDPAGRWAFLNPAWAEATGFSVEESLGTRFLGYIHPDDRPQAQRLFDDLIAGSRGMLRADLRVLARDGSDRVMTLFVRPDQDGAGCLRGLVGSLRDVSEQRRTEFFLKRSVNTNRAILDAMPDLLFRVSREGMVVNYKFPPDISATIAAETFIGRRVEELAPPEVAAQVMRAVQTVLQEGGIQVFECQLPFAGREFDLELRVVVSADEEAIVIVRDVADRRQAERALRQSHEELERRVDERTAELALMNAHLEQEIRERRLMERRYRELFEEAPAQYVITREWPGGPLIVDCNQAFLQGLGYEAELVIGRPLADFYTAESRQRLLHGGYRRALEGQVVEERELVTRDGRVVTVLLRANPERDAGGNVVGTRAMFIDITERKRMEETLTAERASLTQRVEERTAELRAANAELARAARLKDEFLASMSHELRTPLTAILGLTEALQSEAYGPLADRQRAYLRMIEESGRHLLELINDILDLSKIEAGKLQLDPDSVPVAHICESSLRLVRQTALKKQIKVNAPAPPTDLMMEADPRRLKQILVNLLSNAVKFTPEGGEVGLDVEWSAERQAISFSVWDKGIGIPADQLAKLFQPFVQLDSRLSREYNGTGLGLALVYRMTGLHGGSVAVSSSVGQGSRFTVSLPWRPHDEPQPVAVQARELTIPSSQLRRPGRVLVVEDNRANSEMIADFLRASGHTVVIAHNGVEALDLARDQHPDLVLMDIQMPGIDGLEATRRLRQLPDMAQTPVVALTALAMPGDRERCLAAGMNDYLSKPLSLRQLAETVRTWLAVSIRGG